ncbi:hypothetical protein BYT27DRAFT_7080752 [Phlegmacium glaucopus]|nr:hypothetical protein BYT27DRAFT_7080752 [Phlegmacium glaucopus]
MLSKIWASSVLVLALCLQASAHANVAPVLGVQGKPSRGDVKRPNTANPCGAGVNISSEFDSSTAVAADATGSFKVNATSFNGGVDGSLKFTAKVDASGTGTKFVAMNITTNGDNSPQGVESQPVIASLPSGTKCTGGKSRDKCLVQFVSGAGFGNCVVVSQATATGTGDSTTSKTSGSCSAKSAAKKAGKMGSRMARSFLAVLEDRGEEAVEIMTRDTSNWIWV